MSYRRDPRGPTTSVTIGCEAEYRRALRELEVLQRAPLGTAQTEGLQDLIEAILEYEAMQGRVDGNGPIE
jgi:hypothetical protein